MSDKYRTGPHPALLPLFLAISHPAGENIDQTLDSLVKFIQSTRDALQAMRNGMETFEAGMMNIAAPAPSNTNPSPAINLPVNKIEKENSNEPEIPE
ncbi:MAG: hypothetical protein ACOY31_01910 [Bacillota bacterium]